MKNYKDIYKLPLHNDEYSSWVWDDAGNFVFQFEFRNKEKRELIIDVLNGKTEITDKDLSFRHEEGYIISSRGKKIILIRGWGNLTGIGAHNLKEEDAINVQDTFADFIVERLNFRG